MVTESLGSSIAPVLISHVVIKQLGIALFRASSSGWPVANGHPQYPIYNRRLHAYDDERLEATFQGLSKHLAVIKRRLVDPSESGFAPCRCIGLLFREGFCRNAGRRQFDAFVVVDLYTSLGVLYPYGSPGSLSSKYDPKALRRKGRLPFLGQLYHDFEPWKAGKTRLQRKPLQHGLIFHPCVPSTKAYPRG